MKILYCDDLEDRAAEVSEAVHKGRPSAVVQPLVAKDLTSALEALFHRVREAIKAPAKYVERVDHPFDSADIVIVDNNLAELEIAGARLTAESVIGFIRAFAGAPYFVSLNKNPDRDFDLRFLIGDAGSRADLALNSTHLAVSGLWGDTEAGTPAGFLPWYWPRLSDVATRRRAQVAFVRERLESPILQSLDILGSDDAMELLSSHARGALSESNVDASTLKFIDLFETSSRSLPALEERQALLAAFRDGNSNLGAVIARVVAADVDMWLRRDVIAPQDILVDIPHLLMRMPFLLGDGVSDIERWNRAIASNAEPFGLDNKLFDQHLKAARFKHGVWQPSPVFHWPEIKANDALDQLFFSSDQGGWADVAFCEDRSVFVAREEVAESLKPREFLAEFDGPWRRRCVTRIDGVRYAPLSHLEP